MRRVNFALLLLLLTIDCCYYFITTSYRSTNLNYYPKQKETITNQLENHEITKMTSNFICLSEKLHCYLENLKNQMKLLLENSKEFFDNNCSQKINIPKEALDRESAYYSNIYKDTYGLPLSEFGISSFKRFKIDWIKLFPNLLVSLEQYHSKNPLKNPDAFTRINSTLIIEGRENYKVGEMLIAHIQAKDKFGRNKTYGGDYFRVRLIRRQRNGKVVDGIPGKVYDLMNGKYTVSVPLLMSGIMTLEVKLVRSIEGINYLIEYTSKRNHKGLYYEATLNSKEIVECNIELDRFEKYQNKTLCDYGNPRNRETWFCVSPPSGICSPINSIIVKKLLKNPSYNYQSIVSQTYGKLAEIHGSGKQIKISINDNKPSNYAADTSTNELPTGYLQNNQWRLLNQTNHFASLQSYRKCFEHKVVFMFGDSTTRQFFFLTAKQFNLSITGLDSSVIWEHLLKLGRSQDKASNITIYYRAHGPPMRNPGPPESRPYISDSLDGIKIGGENVYIIFNLGLHSLEVETSLYAHRLLGIRDAILRHLRQFPDTRFIVKGMNVDEEPQEWLILRYDLILRKIFHGIKNVFFFDLYDLTTVWPLKQYHPPPPILTQEAIAMFNSMCKWEFH